MSENVSITLSRDEALVLLEFFSRCYARQPKPGGKMKKYVLFISGALAFIFVSSSTSYAWNGRSHMMVAAVAYNKLTQPTKNRVDALLLLNPDRDNWVALIPEGTSATR